MIIINGWLEIEVVDEEMEHNKECIEVTREPIKLFSCELPNEVTGYLLAYQAMGARFMDHQGTGEDEISWIERVIRERPWMDGEEW